MTDAERQKLDITPYYNRTGLAAAGAADEWLRAAQADANERLRNMDPRIRSKMAPGINSFVLGHYQNLRQFEAREVRQGRIAQLASEIETRANGISMNIAAQSRAELESERAERENIDRTAAEMARTDAEAAERHRSGAYGGLDLSRAKRTDEHFMQLIGEMDMAETLIDAAVGDGLIDRATGDARKRKAARACFSNTIAALSANGDHDMAEAFIARLEKPRETDPSKPKEAGATDTVSPLGALYGFNAADIASLRVQNEHARTSAKKLKEAETKAKADALKDSFLKAEREIHSAPIPTTAEDEAQHASVQAVSYMKLADQAASQGLDDVALKYQKTAEALGFRSVGAANEDKRAKARQAKEELAALRQEAFDLADADFEAGAVVSDDGTVVPLTSGEMADRARNLLVNGHITRSQFTKLMAKRQRTLNAEAEEFRNGVLADCKKLIPSAIRWNASRNAFSVAPTGSVRENTKTPYRIVTEDGWFGDRTEAVEYGQLVKMMNLTLDWGNARRASVDEMKAHFAELSKGIVGNIQYRAVEKATAAEQQLIDDWKATHE